MGLSVSNRGPCGQALGEALVAVKRVRMIGFCFAARSSRGPGRRPFKAEIRGSNPLRATTDYGRESERYKARRSGRTSANASSDLTVPPLP